MPTPLFFFLCSSNSHMKTKKDITLCLEIVYIIQCLYILDFLLELRRGILRDKQVSSCHRESTSDTNLDSACIKTAKVYPSFTCLCKHIISNGMGKD